MTTTTPERLARVEEKVDGIKADISEIKDAIKGFDRRYANKLTEKIVYGLVAIVLTAVVYAAASYIIPNTNLTTNLTTELSNGQTHLAR